MKVKALREAVNDWDGTSTDEDIASTSKYGAILSQLEFLGSGEWATYVPAINPVHTRDFAVRLAEWVGQVADSADQQLLLEYARRIWFFSQEDLLALYRSAFSGPITRWIIEQCGFRIDSNSFDQQLHEELHKHTWYCPITDSMEIAGFYHINAITGIDRRPSFKNLEELSRAPNSNASNVSSLKAYIQNKGLKRLVLLEDVVGSGSQAERAVKWAVSNLGVPVMFSPLIVCPRGAGLGRSLVNHFQGQLAFGPVIELSRQNVLGPDREPNNPSEDAFAQRLEELAVRSYSIVSGNQHVPDTAPYGPFGYAQTGSSIVTYSNTPNNTLPLIHHLPPAQTWSPLFPRANRV